MTMLLTVNHLLPLHLQIRRIGIRLSQTISISHVMAGILVITGIMGWMWIVLHLTPQTRRSRQMLEQMVALHPEISSGLKSIHQNLTPGSQTQQKKSRLASPLANSLASSITTPLNDFRATLGDPRQVEQQITTLLALAAKNELALSEAEYQSAHSKIGHFQTYTATFPVKGSYSAIRTFCDQVLQAIPFAALDEVNFKRDSIATTTLSSRLRFTLFLNDTAAAPDSSRPARVIASGASASATQVLALHPRLDLIQADGSGGIGTSLFASHDWMPAPPPHAFLPAAPPPPPPIPTAPPMPFIYLGKKLEDGQWEVYVARNDTLYIVHKHSLLDAAYRVDSITSANMTMTYLPLNQQQTLTIGTAP